MEKIDEVFKRAVGFEMYHPKYGKLTVAEHIPTEWGTLSTFFRCTRVGDTDVTLHENIIRDAINGIMPEAEKKKAAKKGGTVADKVKAFIAEAKEVDADLSNTKLIKLIAAEFGLSKATATSYFYKVREA